MRTSFSGPVSPSRPLFKALCCPCSSSIREQVVRDERGHPPLFFEKTPSGSCYQLCPVGKDARTKGWRLRANLQAKCWSIIVHLLVTSSRFGLQHCPKSSQVRLLCSRRPCDGMGAGLVFCGAFSFLVFHVL